VPPGDILAAPRIIEEIHTALLLGKAVAPGAFDDDTVGRVLDRLYDTGTMKVFAVCAVRADQTFHFDKR
jgi:hypothetical protein